MIDAQAVDALLADKAEDGVVGARENLGLLDAKAGEALTIESRSIMVLRRVI